MNGRTLHESCRSQLDNVLSRRRWRWLECHSDNGSGVAGFQWPRVHVLPAVDVHVNVEFFWSVAEDQSEMRQGFASRSLMMNFLRRCKRAVGS